MKKTLFYISLFIMAAAWNQSIAQSNTDNSTKSTADSKNKNDDKKSSSKTKKGSDASIKNKEAMFQDKNKSWVIGVHGGLPMVIGDIPSQSGIGYGVNIQKAFGYSFALRLHEISGYATGLNWQENGPSTLVYNNAVNGANNPNANYVANDKGIYTNYKMTFNKLSLDAVFYLNNINFNKENQKFLIYVAAGFGGMLFDTKVDQLNANGNMYDYSKINGNNYANRNQTYSQLKSLLDGTYETQADVGDYPKLFGQSLLPFVSGSVGILYRVSDRVSLSLEATYGFTGSDELDGQRWSSNGSGGAVLSSNPDAFTYINLGFNFRLGKTENVSWYSNPLSLPYKTIMENKKKLEKVDKIEKQVADMNKKLDTAMANIDSLLTDSDGDGVADYFDKEDSTPPGAVVDGAGRTIFFKDADGNLVYVDPNKASAGDNSGRGNNSSNDGFGGENNSGNGNNSNGNNGNGNNGNGNNGNSISGENGINGGSGNNGANSVSGKGNRKMHNGKAVFDPNDKSNKTIIYTNPSNKNSTTNNFAGTNSKLGFLPAVFFPTNSADLSQNYYPQLYEVAKMLKQNPSVKMHVIGYTDQRASASYNKKLGMRRAKATEKALTVYFGVKSDQLIVESKGKVDPLTNARSMGAFAANRRVQFQIDGDNTGNLNSDISDKETVKTKS